MNSKELFDNTKLNLQRNNNYDPSELQSLTFWVLEEVFGLPKTAILGNKSIRSTPAQESRLKNIIKRLHHNEPIQYIVGETEFYGRVFKVNPSVLIPRAETEELVDIVIRYYQRAHPETSLKILDLGTGSGCIAISLALELAHSTTYALDRSPLALYTARQNADLNQTQVNFIQADILTIEQNHDLSTLDFDLIISNPPYVRESEKKFMHPNVLRYEPSEAIFVLDSSPFIFYETITFYAFKHLKKGGKLYFEINEAFGREVENILIKAGFEQTRILQDMQKKDRFVEGKKA